jgi:septum formation protein
MKRLILASTSPRRREVLALAGLRFEVHPPEYEEDMTLALPPDELVRSFSLGKAESVAGYYDGREALVIGSDSVVVVGDTVLGKPASSERAKAMLRLLSGRMHKVVTGYAVIDAMSGESCVEALETEVYFRELSDEEITDYVLSGEPLDKAGAYGIQDRGAIFVEKIVGDFYTVVGLPLCRLVRTLETFGVKTYA